MKVDIKRLELLSYSAIMGFIGEIIFLKSLNFLYVMLLGWIAPFAVGVIFAFYDKRQLGTIINSNTLNPLYVALTISLLAIIVFFGLSIYFIAFMDITILAFFLWFFDHKNANKVDLYTSSPELTQRLTKTIKEKPINNLKIVTERNYPGNIAYVGRLLRRQGIIIFDEAIYKSLTETEFECVLMHEYAHYLNMDLTKVALYFVSIVLLYLDSFLLVFKLLFLSNSLYLIITAAGLMILGMVSLPFLLPRALKAISRHLESGADRFSSMEVREGCMKEFRETHEISVQREIRL